MRYDPERIHGRVEQKRDDLLPYLRNRARIWVLRKCRGDFLEFAFDHCEQFLHGRGGVRDVVKRRKKRGRKRGKDLMLYLTKALGGRGSRG
jgi:hypothetical protein